MNKRELLKKYYDKRSECQVLGVLMKDSKRISDKEFRLLPEDFAKGKHQAVFTCVYNLAIQGIQEVGVSEIEGYLASADPVSHKRMFGEDGRSGTEWINTIIDEANVANYEYYLNRVEKYALLREYIKAGCDVSDILDTTKIDPKEIELQQKAFNEMQLNDIIDEMDKRNLIAKGRFYSNSTTTSRKAGDDAEELYEKMKRVSSFGMSLESQYINTITRGGVKKKVYLETRDSGMGKTRTALARMLLFTAPELWDYEQEKFVPNLQGVNNSALYIGTEMDTYEELEPTMWAIVSGVEEDKIKDQTLTLAEEKRVEKAMEILSRTRLYLVDEADYDVHFIRSTVQEYKLKYDISALVLDYVDLGPALIAEYLGGKRGISVREDQVLLNLSKALKDMSKDFDIFVLAFTQTTDEARTNHVRDQRAVKGARSLPNKVDVGTVVFEPTEKELNKIEKIIKNKGLTDTTVPNICHTFYKNRSGKIKAVKVWGHINLGNMHYRDLFCTDSRYRRIDVNPTKITVKATKSKRKDIKF